MATELKLDIGEAQIQNAIAVALAESFAPERREQLIRDIVRAHLSHRENPYDRETILSKSVGKHIRDVSSQELDKVLQGLRPQIEEEVRKTLGDSFKQSVFEAVREALKNVALYGLKVQFQWDPKD